MHLGVCVCLCVCVGSSSDSAVIRQLYNSLDRFKHDRDHPLDTSQPCSSHPRHNPQRPRSTRIRTRTTTVSSDLETHAIRAPTPARKEARLTARRRSRSIQCACPATPLLSPTIAVEARTGWEMRKVGRGVVVEAAELACDGRGVWEVAEGC